ncbi:MAG TPA: purine/pyrimidine permease, partial [Clostridiaceae bacterium]|nr:purine/pyrimidine permease [Clostridiaceae bacterium]
MNNKIKLKYGLDDKPPLFDTFLYGLQWLAISLPTIIVVGQVVAGIHYSESFAQVNYMQKLFFIMAVTMLAQIFVGHRLPAVIGPATVLLVGISSSRSAGPDSIYSSILIGGVFLALLSVSGLFAKLERFFTRQVVAVILLLIAFTLTPTIINLIYPAHVAGRELFHTIYALVLVFAMFIASRLLKGVWKSSLIIWALIVGSFLYVLLVPEYEWMSGGSPALLSNLFSGLDFRFSLDIGVLISFLVCFVALAINDLGSIQSLGQLLNAPNMDKRVSAGITVTGALNAVAGFVGVIGPVNFSLSTGIIASTGVASRFTLVPAGIGLLIISLMPGVISFLSGIPPLIIGVILLYTLCSQIAAGLLSAYSGDSFTFEDGLTIGLPLMLGL